MTLNPSLSAALFERHKQPESVCAGGISYNMLKRAGIKDPPIQHRMRVFRLHSPNAFMELGSDDLRLPYMALVLDRAMFDKRLLRSAKKLGAEVFLNEGVIGVGRTKRGWFIKTTKDFYECKTLVCADGALSEVAQLAGVITSISLEDLHLGFQYEVERSDDVAEIWFDKSYVKSGYIWKFPGGKFSKVGIGASFAEKVRLQQVLNKFMVDKGISGKVIKTSAAPIPTAPPMRRLVYGDLALVGDAGRLCCPVTGGGIWCAVISGRLLGKAIGEGHIENYEEYIEPMRVELRRRYLAKKLLLSFSNRDMDNIIVTMRKFRPKTYSISQELKRGIMFVAMRRPLLLRRTLGLVKEILRRGMP